MKYFWTYLRLHASIKPVSTSNSGMRLPSEFPHVVDGLHTGLLVMPNSPVTIMRTSSSSLSALLGEKVTEILLHSPGKHVEEPTMRR
jgi:hypothetical protein